MERDWKEAWEHEIISSENIDGTLWHRFFVVLPNGDLDYIYRITDHEKLLTGTLMEAVIVTVNTIRAVWPHPAESPELQGKNPGDPEAKTASSLWREKWKADLSGKAPSCPDGSGFDILLTEDLLSYLFEWHLLAPGSLSSALREAVSRLAERFPDIKTRS